VRSTFAYVSPPLRGPGDPDQRAKGADLYLPIIKAVGQNPALASLLAAMSK
jgi:hypothetical protein